jgi:hypothetical protein
MVKVHPADDDIVERTPPGMDRVRDRSHDGERYDGCPRCSGWR